MQGNNNAQIDRSSEKQDDDNGAVEKEGASSREQSATLKERDYLLEQFPKDLEAQGASAIVSYLNKSVATLAPKLGDRDNFILLKHLSYSLCNNTVPCSSAKEAQEVITALLGSLEHFERDLEKCSPTYHVKL